MRTRAKALTVAAAMLLTFAILPTFGAAAAEPLEDGSYDVVIEETTYTVDVVEGAPTIEGAEGVEFTFAFDEETNRVLDEFDVTVDGVAYDVAVADDGTVTVTEDGGDDQGDEGDGEESESDGDDEDLGEGEDLEDEDDADDEGDADGGEDIEALEEGDDDVEALEEGDEANDDGHGAVVSTVAQCAPKGWEARAAGLPNHGFFVSAAAKGEAVEFEADGQAHSADLSSQGGADAFCALAEELLAAAEVEPAGPAAAGGDEDGDGEDGGGKGKGRGNGNGRASAPGQVKKNG